MCSENVSKIRKLSDIQMKKREKPKHFDHVQDTAPTAKEGSLH